MGGFRIARPQLGSSSPVFFPSSNFLSNDNFFLRSYVRFPLLNEAKQSESLKVAATKQSESLKVAATKQDLPLTIPRLDVSTTHRDAAASLEEILKRSPDESTFQENDQKKKLRRSNFPGDDYFGKRKRMSLDSRTNLSKEKMGKIKERRKRIRNERLSQKGSPVYGKDVDFWSEEVEKLIADYSVSGFRNALDWDKIPRKKILHPSQHDWLTNLMQPMKDYERRKNKLTEILGREPDDIELSKALHVPLKTLRRHLVVGQAARNMLIERNLKLVLWEVYRQRPSIRALDDVSLDFSDLCNAGLKGLVVAIDRYQPGRKIRFSTYAFYWIRHYILKAIAHDSVFALPGNIAGLRLQMRRERIKFRRQYGRDPSKEELRALMKLDPEKFQQVCKSSIKPANLRLENLPEEQDGSLSWWIANGSYPIKDDNPSDPRVEVRHFVAGLLSKLTPNEQKIIKARYGFDGSTPKSLREVGSALNLSNESIRKGENRALQKLRGESLQRQAEELIQDLDLAEMAV